MTQSIPRDPVALMAARIAIGLMVLLVVLALLPRQAAAVPVQAQAPVSPLIIVVTPTAQAGPEPPAPHQVPAVLEAAPTAAPTAAPIASVPAAADPPSQLVHNADGSVSLPGSEAWLAQQPAVTNVDPALQIARDAAAAYQQLPAAEPPSTENDQPVTARRPHTGR